jgi:hypothetical protein
MVGWTLGLIIGATLVPMIGGLYGVVRERPSDSRDGLVMVMLGGAVTAVWLAAGVLTVHALQ